MLRGVIMFIRVYYDPIFDKWCVDYGYCVEYYDTADEAYRVVDRI